MDLKLSNRGLITPVAVITAAALLIAFSATFWFINISNRGSVIIDANDKSVSIAESGVRQMINQIRVSPDLSKLGAPDMTTPSSKRFYLLVPKNNPTKITDESGKVIGKFWCRA